MKSPSPEKIKIEGSIIHNVRNLFRLKRELDDTWIKNIRNLLRLKKKNEAIKDRVIRDIRNYFEHEEEDNYKPVRVGNFRSNNCIDYKSNGNRNEAPSIEEYFNKIRLYLKDILNGLKNLIHGKLS